MLWAARVPALQLQCHCLPFIHLAYPMAQGAGWSWSREATPASKVGETSTTRPILDSTPSKPRSTGSVKLTVRVNRVVFAGVGLMVVCPGRGILAQHQHQGSNQEEFSEGHFETKNYPQIPSLMISQVLFAINSQIGRMHMQT